MFKTQFPLEELEQAVMRPLQKFLAQKYDIKLPLKLMRAPDFAKATFTCPIQPVAGRLKKNVKSSWPAEFAEEVNQYFLESKSCPYYSRCYGEQGNGFLFFVLDMTIVFKETIRSVLDAGDRYGSSDRMKGKKVVVEHTSANPNGPLHVGNLRNAILGSHLSQLFKNVGYTVEQRYFVNDLGAQIGMTALGYQIVQKKMEPTLKLDQWIGLIYAVMNTLQELQEAGLSIDELHELVLAGKSPKQLAKEGDAKTTEYTDILEDLSQRQPDMVKVLLEGCKGVESIRKVSGEMNLKYERNDPEAVKLFREMVLADLSGIQQTLDLYAIQHDTFDFESELGWDGSNEAVTSIFEQLPYYVPPTQCNAEGKPQGGYLDMQRYIEESGLPQGKKGYNKPYPNFYIFRPDGSTLYTLRDVAYTMKKGDGAELVFNVIGCEQNLPQEKVILASNLLSKSSRQVQYHVSYELVKLFRDGKPVKMSGRRGRYELADKLYEELRGKLASVMKEKYENKASAEITPEFVEHVTDELATATMKYTLLGTGQKSQIVFDIDRVTSTKDQTAPYVLYNATRLFSIFREFERKVQESTFGPLPPIEEVDFAKLGAEIIEIELLLKFILAFPNEVYSTAVPHLPPAPSLPDIGTHKLVDFLFKLVQTFSKSYYSKVRIISTDDVQAMYARIYLCKALQTVMVNAFRILTIKPLERM